MVDFKRLFQEYHEFVVLFVFFVSMTWVGPATVLDRQIVHDFPFGYFAGDAYIHGTGYTDTIMTTGSFYKYAFFFAAGFYDVIAAYPPLSFVLGALYSFVTGFRAFVSAYFVLFFFEIWIALVLYLLLRRVSVQLAMFSLPLMLMVFTKTFVTVFTWGTWTQVTSVFFLVAFFWVLWQLKDWNYSYVFIALFLSATFLAKVPEFVFGVFFLVGWMVIQFFKKQFSREILFTLLKAALIVIVLCSYYAFVFKYTWGHAVYGQGTFSFGYLPPKWENSGILVPLWNDFGWLKWVILTGMVLSVMVLKKDQLYPFAVSFFLFIMSLSNYVGFGKRAFHMRYHWPVILAPFIALPLFVIVKRLLHMNKEVISLLSIFLIVGSAYALDHPSQGYGLLNRQQFEAMEWIRLNTNEDVKVLFFYGDAYTQGAPLYLTQRQSYRVDTDDFVATLNNQTIKRFYKAGIQFEGGGGLPYKISPLEFAYHYEDVDTSRWAPYPRDMCGMDFFVFDRFARQPQLAQYNMLIANAMLQAQSVDVVLQNDAVVLLKNKKKGELCFNVSVSS